VGGVRGDGGGFLFLIWKRGWTGERRRVIVQQWKLVRGLVWRQQRQLLWQQ
jgi:hypothetical protein